MSKLIATRCCLHSCLAAFVDTACDRLRHISSGEHHSQEAVSCPFMLITIQKQEADVSNLFVLSSEVAAFSLKRPSDIQIQPDSVSFPTHLSFTAIPLTATATTTLRTKTAAA